MSMNFTDANKLILSRDGKDTGVITSTSERYCAGCGRFHSCYVVSWLSGRTTKPYTMGVFTNAQGVKQVG